MAANKDYILRPWQLTDKPSLMKHADNIKIAKYMRDGFVHPYTEACADGFLSMVVDKEDCHIYAIVIDGQAVGGIGLHPLQDVHHRNAEIGYWLGESYWGRGIMTKAVRQMVAHAWEHLDVTRIYASVFGSNIGSHHVIKNAGFILEATLSETIYKMGTYEDEYLYGIRRG